MTILFLSRLFYPHIGGVEKHVMEISRLLVKKGHQVSVVTEELPIEDIPVYLQLKKLPEHEIVNSIEIYRIPVGKNEWFKKFQIWIWLFKNINLIKMADIVHAHDVFFWYLPFRFLFPFKKVFTTFHGYESYPLKPKDILVHKLSEKLSNGNICIGDFIQKWYGTKPTLVSYGGVNEMKNEKLKIKNEKSAVSVGRLDEQTGFLTYLEAVKKIREKFPDFKFTVFGDGKLRSKMSKDIDFKGFVENPEKELPKFNFIFTSRYLSILEAMAARRLVVAVYDNPLKEDYLKMSPFVKYIIIANSADEIAKNVFYFSNNPQKEKKLIDEAFEWTKEQSWGNLSNIYIRLWRRNR